MIPNSLKRLVNGRERATKRTSDSSGLRDLEVLALEETLASMQAELEQARERLEQIEEKLGIRPMACAARLPPACVVPENAVEVQWPSSSSGALDSQPIVIHASRALRDENGRIYAAGSPGAELVAPIPANAIVHVIDD